MERQTFRIADYCVFAACLLLSLAIGLYHAFTGGKQRTRGEYFMGNRQMSLVPVSLSMMASLVSANTLIGVPAEMYTYGINLWVSFAAFGPCLLIIAFTIVPLLYNLKITSCYEYLEIVYESKIPKRCASVLFLVKQFLYLGTVLYGPATALEAVTGLPARASIVTVTTVAAVYTALGGMKAVVWTDVFQAVVMYTGLLVLIIQGCNKVGGIKEVFAISKEERRVDLDDFFDFPGTKRFNAYALLGWFVLWMVDWGFNQPSTQRFCALPSLTKAKIAMLLCIPSQTLVLSMSGIAGLVAYVYYFQKGCDPLLSGEMGNSNQILAVFTLEILGYPGVPGLIIACFFSGALSTVSSSLNSMAACIWEDFIREKLGHLSQLRTTIILKIMVFLIAVICIATAFLMEAVGGTLVQLCDSFVGLLSGPMLGMFFMAGMLPFTDAWGATVGGLAGLILPTWMLSGYISLNLRHQTLPGRTDGCRQVNASDFNNQSIYYNTVQNGNTTVAPSSSSIKNLSPLDRFYATSHMWYPVIGFVISIITGCLISVVTSRKKSRKIQKSLLCPCIRPCSGDDTDEQDKVEENEIFFLSKDGEKEPNENNI